MDVRVNIIKKYVLYIIASSKRRSKLNKTRKYARLSEVFARKKMMDKFSHEIVTTVMMICKAPFGKQWELIKINKGAFRRMWTQFEDNRWYNQFRMTKGTFLYVCSLVEEELAPSEIKCNAREPLTVMEQVAIAVYKLATYSEFRVVAEVFGVGKTTIHKCLHRFVKAMNKRAKEFIALPDPSECKKIAKKFKDISNIPQIIGCIDGCHIPIMAPAVGYRDYVNRKGWASYVLQAVVDCNYKFRDISCKYPGSAHDAAVFYDSGLYKTVENVFPKGAETVNGCTIPYFLVGDPAYPLLPWLMKNFPAPKSQEEESFYAYMNKARVIVENAFGRLKSRWHGLAKRIDLDYRNCPNIVLTCCILHNIVEDRKEDVPVMGSETISQAERLLNQPEREEDNLTNSNAELIRNTLKTYLKENFEPLNVTHF